MQTEPMATVLIVSAGMGAGHNAAAAELARRLETAGAEAAVVDLLELAGPAGRRLRRTYRLLLDHAPWIYSAAMAFWVRRPGAMERLTASGARPFEDALAGTVARSRPDLVVATFNLAAQCLGRLVARGAVDPPVVTVMTDAGAHPYWVSPLVAVHLVPSALTARTLERYGAQRTTVTAPLVGPRFTDPPDRATARARLGLAHDARVVVVAGGSWGTGRLDASLGALAASRDVTVLVLCGRDEALLARLRNRSGVLAVGWTDDTPTYLSAADVLVDNAGGQTCWEAIACGTPVVVYRPLPGHGVLNARALDELGWARYARTAAELRSAVRGAYAPDPASGPFAAADAAAEVLQLARGRRHVRP